MSLMSSLKRAVSRSFDPIGDIKKNGIKSSIMSTVDPLDVSNYQSNIEKGQSNAQALAAGLAQQKMDEQNNAMKSQYLQSQRSYQPQMIMPTQQQPAFNPMQQRAMNPMSFGGNRPQQQYTPQMMPMRQPMQQPQNTMQNYPPMQNWQMPQNQVPPQNQYLTRGPAFSGAPNMIQNRFQ